MFPRRHCLKTVREQSRTKCSCHRDVSRGFSFSEASHQRLKMQKHSSHWNFVKAPRWGAGRSGSPLFCGGYLRFLPWRVAEGMRRFVSARPHDHGDNGSCVRQQARPPEAQRPRASYAAKKPYKRTHQNAAQDIGRQSLRTPLSQELLENELNNNKLE